MIRLFPITLLALSSLVFAPKAKSQQGLNSGQVQFLGEFKGINQEACNFSGDDIGDLGFKKDSSEIVSISPAKIIANITPTINYPLQKFRIRLNNLSLERKPLDFGGSFTEISVSDEDKGLDVVQAVVGSVPTPEKGNVEVNLQPLSSQSPLLVGVVFDTPNSLEEGDYRSSVDLSCFLIGS